VRPRLRAQLNYDHFILDLEVYSQLISQLHTSPNFLLQTYADLSQQATEVMTSYLEWSMHVPANYVNENALATGIEKHYPLGAAYLNCLCEQAGTTLAVGQLHNDPPQPWLTEVIGLYFAPATALGTPSPIIDDQQNKLMEKHPQFWENLVPYFNPQLSPWEKLTFIYTVHLFLSATVQQPVPDSAEQIRWRKTKNSWLGKPEIPLGLADPLTGEQWHLNHHLTSSECRQAVGNGILAGWMYIAAGESALIALPLIMIFLMRGMANLSHYEQLRAQADAERTGTHTHETLHALSTSADERRRLFKCGLRVAQIKPPNIDDVRLDQTRKKIVD
jgi:hypothetical protein